MKQFLLIFSVLVFISCSSKYGEKPEVLLSQDELEDVMFEMSIMQAAENTSRTDSGKIMDTYSYIKKRFGFDSTAIVSSTLYYANDYKEYEDMNKRVYKRLQDYRSKYTTPK